jgi:hypothetical protein
MLFRREKEPDDWFQVWEKRLRYGAPSGQEDAMKHALKPSSKPKITQVAETSKGLESQIRIRAYELYEQRGKGEGREIDDWLEAEAELVRQKAKAAVAAGE